MHPKRKCRSHSKFPFDSVCEPPLRRHHHQHFPQHPVACNNGCHQQDRHQLAIPAKPLRAGDRDRRRSLRPREQHTGPEGLPSAPAVRLCPRGKKYCPSSTAHEFNSSGTAPAKFRGSWMLRGKCVEFVDWSQFILSNIKTRFNMEKNYQWRRHATKKRYFAEQHAVSVEFGFCALGDISLGHALTFV